MPRRPTTTNPGQKKNKQVKKYHPKPVASHTDEDSTVPFTKVQNEMLEILAKAHLTLYEFRALFVILRQVNGYHKRSDLISLDQFVLKTGIERRHMQRAVKMLESRGIISASRGYRRCKNFRINGNFSEWRLAPQQATVRKTRPVTATSASTSVSLAPLQAPSLAPLRATVLSPLQAPTKETLKENRKENLKESDSPSAFGATGCASEKDRREEHPTGFSCLREGGKREGTKDKEETRRLSVQRNVMFKSGLYTDEELVTLKDKSLSELESIHGGRVLGKAETVAFTEGAAA